MPLVQRVTRLGNALEFNVPGALLTLQMHVMHVILCMLWLQLINKHRPLCFACLWFSVLRVLDNALELNVPEPVCRTRRQ